MAVGTAWPQQGLAGEPKVLRVVADDGYPPFMFRDPAGRAVGYVADWWHLWQEKTGVHVELTATNWAEAQKIIGRGEVDAIDCIFRTPAREPLYEFSKPYVKLPVAIYVEASIAGILDAKGLNGFRVGAMEGDACIERLHEHGVEGLHLYKSYADLIRGALADEVRVFCLDEYPANYYLYRLGAEQQFRKAFQLYQGEFHRAVRKGDVATLQLIEKGAAAITTAENAALLDKWRPEPANHSPYLHYLAVALAALLVVAIALLIWVATVRAVVKRQTSQLRDSEELFRRLFEDTRQAITLIEGGRFVAANAASLRMMGFDRLEQFVGKSPADVSPEFQDDGERSTDKAMRLIQQAMVERSAQFEWRHLRADGESFVANVLLTPIRQGQKDLLHVVWSDISVQKQVEHELAEYRNSLEQKVAQRTAELASASEVLRILDAEKQAVFDAAPVGILMSRDRIITHCNRALEQLYGFEPGELIGKSTRLGYITEDDFNATATGLARAMADGEQYRQQLEMKRKDGTTFWARWIVQAVSREDMSLGMVVTVEDISDERQALAEMAEGRRLAEEAARTKADFLANMSHEIRTPMNAVIGLSHLLLNTELSPRQRGYLENVQHAGRHLMGIINDILDFSKIDAGKLTIEDGEFDLAKVLDHVASMLAEKASGKGLRLRTDLPADLPTRLIGDSLRLQQVLLNLGSNAVKFTQQGEVNISAAIVARSPHEVTLRLSVRDTGIGISVVDQGKLFQSFQQADTSTTRKYGGTGLGLMISRRLVELMGGELGVTSKPGRGSTFWFTVRLAISAALPLEVPAPSATDEANWNLAGAHVLLAEDNDLNQEVARDLLANAGLTVDVADNGAIAVEMVQRQDYALVLMDMQMPVMDGLAATRKIRALPGREHLPIIAVTANVLEDDRRRCADAGMNDYLAKPIEPAELLLILRRWLPPRPTEPVPVQSADAGLARVSAPRSDEQVDSPLQGIVGLDVTAGLRHVGGTVATYISLLQAFAQRQRSTAESIALALDSGDRAAAERHAHTLSGLAGTIGAPELQGAANMLQEALKVDAPRDELARLTEQLSRELAQVVVQIQARLPSEAPTTAVTVDAEALGVQCRALIDLLANDDPRARRVLQDHEGLFRAAFPAEFDGIRWALQEFDFDAARHTVERAWQQWQATTTVEP